eukprot:1009186-Rhodomonas_salina.1
MTRGSSSGCTAWRWYYPLGSCAHARGRPVLIWLYGATRSRLMCPPTFTSGSTSSLASSRRAKPPSRYPLLPSSYLARVPLST